MNEMPEREHGDGLGDSRLNGSVAPSQEAPSQEAVSRWGRLRIGALRVVAVLGAFLFVATLMAAFSGVYTSRPQFCRSCHNMEPYYVSWQESSHSHVSCIKCHFPPGVGEKIRGKMLGLVQLAKYVTSTEGPRPAAEISDLSCLRSGCHETRLLAGKVDFNGVPFDHTPHLQELKRGKKLRCTSCHSQIVQGSHMSVTTSTCYLCHFKDQHFNQGLGTCTRCHQIPTEVFDLGGGATFDHDMAYRRAVDCANCHGDLTRGQGEVPFERCTVCHNRQHDLERIDDHEFLHQKHVTDHNVDCMECHLTILHTADPDRIEHAANDCSSCHPDQHRRQINMFEGVGALTAPNTPNAMVGARITCASCHQAKTVTDAGNVLWTASQKMCSQCHDDVEIDRLWATHSSLRRLLDAMDQSVLDLRQSLGQADLEAVRTAEVETQLAEIEEDLKFLRIGNGIHNIHYASSLTQGLVQRITDLCKLLDVDSSNLILPDHSEVTEGAFP
jgi:predicted CXXCH cytochrome family protein